MVAESVSTDCMTATVTYAATETYTEIQGMTGSGRKYAFTVSISNQGSSDRANFYSLPICKHEDQTRMALSTGGV